jgi:hypothetical protein
MSTPEDPREGGWEPQGWKSEWQQPGGWQQPTSQPQPQPQPTTGGWQQGPDGQLVQAGGERHSSGKSTASLVLGIVGLVLCPFICSILALVFGYQARREIDSSGGTIGGRGNATAGIVLGWIGVAFAVLFIVLVIIGVLAGDSGSSNSAPTGVPA